MHDLRRHALIVAIAGAFFLSQSLQSPTAQAGESGTTGSYPVGAYIYCSSDPDQPVVYFSDFFVAQTGASVTTAHNSGHYSGPDPVVKMQNDFLAYLKQKYAFKSNSNYPTGCPSFGAGATGLSRAQASKKNLLSQYEQAKKKIVETGWKSKP